MIAGGKEIMDNRIFMSYSRADAEFALKLASDLKAVGANVWIDQLDIPTGARWDNEIEHALEQCGSFMVILSPASAGSENVKDEIAFAVDRGKNLIPVMYRPTQIPFRLHRFQYIDFTQDYGLGLNKLQALIQGTRMVSEPVRVSRTIQQPLSRPMPRSRKQMPVLGRAITGFFAGAVCILLAEIVDGYTSLEDVLVLGTIAAVVGILAYPSRRSMYLVGSCAVVLMIGWMILSGGEDLATYVGYGGLTGAGVGAILSRALAWAKEPQ